MGFSEAVESCYSSRIYSDIYDYSTLKDARMALRRVAQVGGGAALAAVCLTNGFPDHIPPLQAGTIFGRKRADVDSGASFFLRQMGLNET